MYTAKHAMLYKHKVHGGKAYVFYMDIRAAGKAYDEFTRRAIEEDEVSYIRGRVSTHLRGRWTTGGEGRGYAAWAEMPVEIKADMVVLATAVQAQEDSAARNWPRRCT